MNNILTVIGIWYGIPLALLIVRSFRLRQLSRLYQVKSPGQEPGTVPDGKLLEEAILYLLGFMFGLIILAMVHIETWWDPINKPKN